MSALEKSPEVEADELGLNVVYPEDDQLLLDIDSDEDAAWLEKMLDVLRENGVELRVEKTTTSKSGNHHVYIRIDRDLTPIERVALQACLGSDRKRELLSTLRIWYTNRAPTVLFERPE